MTFHDVFKHLWAIDQEASSLLHRTGFLSDNRLGACVCSLTDTAEDAFLRDKAEQLLESLEFLHDELSYLKKPVLGEYQLERLPNGRWGYFNALGVLHSFSCGKTIEVKMYDRFGMLRWVKTRIEHDGSDYFLWAGRGVPLSGLTVRERGETV